jgi:quercetin dioxygenase-like cupin family protein
MLETMKVISLKNVEKNKVTMEGAKDAYKQVPLSRNDGAPVYAYRVFTIEPNGYTPYHQHNFEHMNYIIEGEGVLVNEKGEETPVKQGDFALVMPNEKHQYMNKSKRKPMVMICGVPREFE